ncbi:MAG: hypothetical protein KGJ80_08365 [Chloroflexota bacterium]|nr:hypothetical protein [Chloroflexota bacterium]
MKTWFTSLSGAITLFAVALITELWRAFVDLLVPVYPFWTEPFKGAGMVFLATLLYTILFVAWALALLRALRGSRGALIAAFIINLFFLLAVPVGTLAAYCPSPCATVWPLMELLNWINLLFGLLAAVALALQLGQKRVAR